jgi:hypothetical protein
VAINPLNPAVVAPAARVNPDPSNPAGFDGVWSDFLLLANKPYGVTQGMRRDTDYNNQQEPSLNPSGGYGYSTQSDIFEECNCWIDTGTKHGLLTFGVLAKGSGSSTIASSPAPTTTSIRLTSPIPNLAVGELIAVGSADPNVKDNYPNGLITCAVASVSSDGLTVGISEVTYKGALPTAGKQVFRGLWYSESNSWFTAQKRTLFVHDPGDIAKVAQGALDPYAIQPAWQHDAPTLFPFQPQTLSGGNGWGDQRHVKGCVWDPLDKKVYLLIPGAYPWGDGSPKTVVVRLSIA